MAVPLNSDTTSIALPPPAAANPPKKTFPIVISVAICALVACGAVAAYFFVPRPPAADLPSNSPTDVVQPTPTPAEPTPSPTPAAPESPALPAPQGNPLLMTDPPVDATMRPLSLPSLPQLSLDPIQAAGSDNAPNIQKFADDVAAGDPEAIVFNCWTQPADDIRTVYGSATMRGAILQALARTPAAAQGGVTWQGDYVRVLAYWEEAESNYPCPTVTWGGDAGLGDFTPAMAHWRMTRILAVEDGTPVHTGDGTDYALVCDADCAVIWTPHSHDPHHEVSGSVPIMSASAAQWDRLRALSSAEIAVEHISSDFYRVRAVDGSTDALAYFTADYSTYWLPYELGEID